jgi:hypothetical protein
VLAAATARAAVPSFTKSLRLGSDVGMGKASCGICDAVDRENAGERKFTAFGMKLANEGDD